MTEAGGLRRHPQVHARATGVYTRVAGVTDLSGSYANAANPTSYGVLTAAHT